MSTYFPAPKDAYRTFMAQAELKSADLEHRRKIRFNMHKYHAAVQTGISQFTNLPYVREFAKIRKWQAIEHLHEQLLQFEKQAIKNGAEVYWAADAAEANEIIGLICREYNAKTVVKSKSMVTEEIHLNDFLENIGIRSIETDLGEYIQQLDEEPPYHIVTPAMHKSKEDVARLFANKLGCEPNLSPEELTQVARFHLRKQFAEAEVGITGANFLIAETGSIALTENEGNARLSTTFVNVHIAIAGIEKVIPSLKDLAIFWPLLSTFGTGQKVTSYNTIISGPAKPGETDGPERMVIILLDNGRTHMLADPKVREALFCIRCGSCLNACPVYRNIGGHTYGVTYSGPIGKVITPWLEGWEYKHLSHASSLCGACTDACPVNIQLHELLLYNRHEAVRRGRSALAERLAWKGWKTACQSRALFNVSNGRLKTKMVSNLFTVWTKHRNKLEFAPKTFNEMWKDGDLG